jgi:hypothetical protein
MYAAMSAVQMMEPRMDVGLNPANNRSVQDALAAGAAPPQPSLEETLSLCEGLLVRECCARRLSVTPHLLTAPHRPQVSEATWHAGHTLADTLLTCLYLHTPPPLAPDASPVAAAVVAAARCALGQQLVLATRADVYEEEDLSIHQFGFSFTADATVEGADTCLQAVAAATAWLDATTPDVAPPQLVEALRSHLQLRAAVIEAQRLVLERGNTLRCHPGDVDALRQALQRAHAAIQHLGSGHAADAAAPQRCGFDSAVSARLLGGALPRAIKLMALPLALRSTTWYILHLSCVLDAAVGTPCCSLHGLVSWFDAFTRGEVAPTSPPVVDSPPASTPAEPATLARSAALLVLLPDDQGLSQLALDDLWAPNGIAACGAPSPGAPPAPATSTAPPSVGPFLTAAGRACDAMLRAMASSRSRSRRRMRHVTAEWAPLIDTALVAEGTTPPPAPNVFGDPPGGEAATLAAALALSSLEDQGSAAAGAAANAEALHSWIVASLGGDEAWKATNFCVQGLSTWAARWEAWVQAHHLEAGLGLDLYDPTELGPLFWYLDFLISWQVDTLSQGEESFVTATSHETRATAQQAVNGWHAAKAAHEAAVMGGDKKKVKKAEAQLATAAAEFKHSQLAFQQATSPRASPVLTRLHATRLMCGAYVRAWFGLQLEGVLKGAIPRDTPFNDDSLRYWQRYGTFHNYSTPPALHFLQWEEFTDMLLVGSSQAAAAAAAEAQGAAAQAAPEGGDAAVTGKPAMLYKAAEERFRMACVALRDCGPDASAAAKCAGANAVACALLVRGGGAVAGGHAVSLEAGPFRGWPMLKLARTQAGTGGA